MNNYTLCYMIYITYTQILADYFFRTDYFYKVTLKYKLF